MTQTRLLRSLRRRFRIHLVAAKFVIKVKLVVILALHGRMSATSALDALAMTQTRLLRSLHRPLHIQAIAVKFVIEAKLVAILAFRGRMFATSGLDAPAIGQSPCLIRKSDRGPTKSKSLFEVVG